MIRKTYLTYQETTSINRRVSYLEVKPRRRTEYYDVFEVWVQSCPVVRSRSGAAVPCDIRRASNNDVSGVVYLGRSEANNGPWYLISSVREARSVPPRARMALGLPTQAPQCSLAFWVSTNDLVDRAEHTFLFSFALGMGRDGYAPGLGKSSTSTKSTPPYF